MEGNKDESVRCINLAQHLINDGQRDKALKYLQKAERLYPSQRAKDLIELLQKLSDATDFTDETPSEDKQKPNSPKPQMRNRKSFSGKGESDDAKENDYTQEQLEAVKRIKSCKDYYEILGVAKDCADTELKKQYKKLALQFHPDKNKSPGAAEAFKAIGNAFAVLNDAEKRKQYDMYGTEEAQRRQHSHMREQYDYTRGFEGDISAEELFNMFFGGGFPSGGNVYVRRGQRWHQFRQQGDAQQENGYGVLLQMMPILVLVCLSLMSSLFVSDPPYSFTRTSKYVVERKTANFKVAYYVKDNFASEYQGSIRRIEAQVEEDYVNNLRSSCFRERNYKEGMIWRARNFRDHELEEKAKALRTPSCDALNSLYDVRGL